MLFLKHTPLCVHAHTPTLIHMHTQTSSKKPDPSKKEILFSKHRVFQARKLIIPRPDPFFVAAKKEKLFKFCMDPIIS